MYYIIREVTHFLYFTESDKHKLVYKRNSMFEFWKNGDSNNKMCFYISYIIRIQFNLHLLKYIQETKIVSLDVKNFPNYFR